MTIAFQLGLSQAANLGYNLGAQSALDGGGNVFDPLSLNPVFWFDGSDPAGNGVIPSDGTSISTWVDKSGNTLNATQGTGAQQPIFRAEWQNDNGMLFYTGLSTMIMADNPLLDFTSGFTLFAVAIANNSGVLLEKRDAGGNLGWQTSLITGGGANSGQQWCSDSTTGGCVYTNETLEFGVASTFLWNVQANGIQLAQDGINQYTDPGDFRPDNIANSDVYIGSFRASGNFIEAYVGDLIGLVSPSAQDIANLQTWASNKWGTP